MRDGNVYVIQAISLGWIKIGWAKDIARRMVEIASEYGVELRLLGSFRGTQADEAATQKRFIGERIAYDWFAPSGPLEAFACELPSLVQISFVGCSGSPRNLRGRLARAGRTRRGPLFDLLFASG